MGALEEAFLKAGIKKEQFSIDNRKVKVTLQLEGNENAINTGLSSIREQLKKYGIKVLSDSTLESPKASSR